MILILRLTFLNYEFRADNFYGIRTYTFVYNYVHNKESKMKVVVFLRRRGLRLLDQMSVGLS